MVGAKPAQFSSLQRYLHNEYLTLIRAAGDIYYFWNFKQLELHNAFIKKNFLINVFLKKHLGSIKNGIFGNF
jgi:hypothetical protein